MSLRELNLLSVVAPVYNEEATIVEFHRRVAEALSGLSFELILVDDGSSDGSAQKMREIAAGDDRVKVVYLSRNFGHQMALTAGLDHAKGGAIVMIDADLQDPPEVILEMLQRWREGSDVIYAVREYREGESYFKLATASWFYKVFDWLTNVELRHNSGDFRLLDRKALDAMLSMRERSRFLRGMTVWVGFTQSAVPYHRDARHAGETKFTLSRMLRFSLDAISAFSYRPLQLATLFGFVISMLALIAIPVVIALKVVGSYLPGFSTVEVSLLLLGGIQLITIGIIGEYVGRIFDEVKGRPLYVVKATANMPESAPFHPGRRASDRQNTSGGGVGYTGPDRRRRAGDAPGAGAEGRGRVDQQVGQNREIWTDDRREAYRHTPEYRAKLVADLAAFDADAAATAAAEPYFERRGIPSETASEDSAPGGVGSDSPVDVPADRRRRTDN